MPGWTGLADARATIFGELYALPEDMQGAARDLFLEKHAGRESLPLNRFFRRAARAPRTSHARRRTPVAARPRACAFARLVLCACSLPQKPCHPPLCRMHTITDVYFVGGFGTVQWVGVDEYLTAAPDAIAANKPLATVAVRCARRGRVLLRSARGGASSQGLRLLGSPRPRARGAAPRDPGFTHPPKPAPRSSTPSTGSSWRRTCTLGTPRTRRS